MSRKTDIQLARIQSDINAENARAERDIAILQNDTNIRVAQLQARTQFQTAVLQTLGSAFQTGMQSYLQIKAEERKQEKENMQFALQWQRQTAQDKRDEARFQLEKQKADLEIEGLQREATGRDLYQSSVLRFVSAVESGNQEAAASANAQLLTEVATLRDMPDGTRSRIPMPDSVQRLYLDGLSAAKAAYMDLSVPNFENPAQDARNAALTATGPVGDAARVALTAGYADLFASAESADLTQPEQRAALISRIDGLNSEITRRGLDEIWAPVMQQSILLRDAVGSNASVDEIVAEGYQAVVRQEAAAGLATVQKIQTTAGTDVLQKSVNRVLRNPDPVVQKSLARSMEPIEKAREAFGDSLDPSDVSAAETWVAFRQLPLAEQDRIRASQPSDGGQLREAERAYKDLMSRRRAREEGSVAVSKPIAGDQVYYYSQNMALFGKKGTPEYVDAEQQLATRRAEKEDALMAGVDLSVLLGDPNTSGLVQQDRVGAYITKGGAADLIRMGDQGVFDSSPRMLGVLRTMRENAQRAERTETFPKGLVKRLGVAGAPGSGNGGVVTGELPEIPTEWTVRDIPLEQDVGAHAKRIQAKAGGGGTSMPLTPAQELVRGAVVAGQAAPVEFSQDGRPGVDTAEVTALRKYAERSAFAREALRMYDATEASARWQRLSGKASRGYDIEGPFDRAYTDWAEAQQRLGKEPSLEAFLVEEQAVFGPRERLFGDRSWTVEEQRAAGRQLGWALRNAAQGTPPTGVIKQAVARTEKPVTSDTLRAAAVDHAADQLLRVYQTTMFNREDGTMRELRTQSQRAYGRAIEALDNYKAQYPKMAEITDDEIVAEVQRRVVASGSPWLPVSFQARITGVQKIAESGGFSWRTLQMPGTVGQLPMQGAGVAAEASTATPAVGATGGIERTKIGTF